MEGFTRLLQNMGHVAEATRGVGQPALLLQRCFCVYRGRFLDCQPFIISINAVILIVAKLENVSDTAYGKMIWLLWRIAPHV
jgi:hypothetical protein